ncbi:uncharacterized protein LOC109541851 [Dendroctonus ponderosae]|uniref:Uncharacterized protein n=1 Tax=Dendroctonus ponderosae TaxID=77166 RepID=J3JVG2_DENPD
MFKFVAVVFAAILAVAVAAPQPSGLLTYSSPLAYSSPYAYSSSYAYSAPYAYTAPLAASYPAAPLAYSAYSAPLIL